MQYNVSTDDCVNYDEEKNNSVDTKLFSVFCKTLEIKQAMRVSYTVIFLSPLFSSFIFFAEYK